MYELRRYAMAGGGVQLIILLCGGDKRTQHEDIALARQYWNDWKRRSS